MQKISDLKAQHGLINLGTKNSQNISNSQSPMSNVVSKNSLDSITPSMRGIRINRSANIAFNGSITKLMPLLEDKVIDIQCAAMRAIAAKHEELSEVQRAIFVDKLAHSIKEGPEPVHREATRLIDQFSEFNKVDVAKPTNNKDLKDLISVIYNESVPVATKCNAQDILLREAKIEHLPAIISGSDSVEPAPAYRFLVSTVIAKASNENDAKILLPLLEQRTQLLKEIEESYLAPKLTMAIAKSGNAEQSLKLISLLHQNGVKVNKTRLPDNNPYLVAEIFEYTTATIRKSGNVNLIMKSFLPVLDGSGPKAKTNIFEAILENKGKFSPEAKSGIVNELMSRVKNAVINQPQDFSWKYNNTKEALNVISEFGNSRQIEPLKQLLKVENNQKQSSTLYSSMLADAIVQLSSK